MKRRSFCGSGDHVISRRGFLGALAGTAACADMTAIQALASPEVSSELRRQQKSCILLWLAGGSSQLETFDPKPGVPTGGPFGAIQTSVPGVRISELMPKIQKGPGGRVASISLTLCSQSASVATRKPSINWGPGSAMAACNRAT